MEINVITYNSAIAAIAKASRRLSKVSSSSTSTKELSIKALNLLKQMLQEGISPDTYSYSASIAACASAGRWEEALNLIQRMEKGGQRTKPNNVAYTSAICEWMGKILLLLAFSDLTFFIFVYPSNLPIYSGLWSIW